MFVHKNRMDEMDTGHTSVEVMRTASGKGAHKLKMNFNISDDDEVACNKSHVMKNADDSQKQRLTRRPQMNFNFSDDEEDACDKLQELVKTETHHVNVDASDKRRQKSYSKDKSDYGLKCTNSEEWNNGVVSPSVKGTKCDDDCQQYTGLKRHEINNSSNRPVHVTPDVKNMEKVNCLSVTEDVEEQRIHMRTLIFPATPDAENMEKINDMSVTKHGEEQRVHMCSVIAPDTPEVENRKKVNDMSVMEDAEEPRVHMCTPIIPDTPEAENIERTNDMSLTEDAEEQMVHMCTPIIPDSPEVENTDKINDTSITDDAGEQRVHMRTRCIPDSPYVENTDKINDTSVTEDAGEQRVHMCSPSIPDSPEVENTDKINDNMSVTEDAGEQGIHMRTPSIPDSPEVENTEKINETSVTEDVEEKRVHMHTINIPDVDKGISIRNQDSENSDDDDFDNFLNKVKKDIQDVAEKESSRKELPSLDVFIVDDDESEDSASENGGSSSDDEDEVFYIKTNRMIDRDSRTMSYDCSNEIYAGQTNSFKDDPEFRKQQKKNSRPSEDIYSSSDDSLLWSPSPSEKTKGKAKNMTSEVDTESLQNSMQNLSLFGKTESSEIWSKKSDYTPSLNKTTVATYKTKPTKIDEKISVYDSSQIPTTPTSVRTSGKGFTKAASFEGDTRDFKTPDTRIKGISRHMMTAPRPMLPNPADGDKAFFLKSLAMNYPDWKRHPEAQRFVKGFSLLKDELTSKLFRIFNEAIFDTKLPDTISLEWSTRYTKTAGTFSYRQKSSLAKITLSQKVCDSPERVRDTMAHELCHAAVKLINGVNESHGRFWKSWAGKINKTFPFMPLVARCHDYVINTKYTYQCVNCKYRVGRHSKSLDTDNKVCGHCHGRFELYLTKDLNSADESMSYTPRAPNKFASYVKEHYSEKKEEKHGVETWRGHETTESRICIEKQTV